jgi:hypothetical protein
MTNIFIAMNDYAKSDRFERVSPSLLIGSSGFRPNGRIGNRINPQTTSDIGDFLSRLWALFGPPDDVQFEGYTYALRDRETGLTFRAYCAGSGPAYGGFQDEAAALEPILDAFDTLLQNTAPADCELEFKTDFGLYKTGAIDGVPFGRTIESDESELDESNPVANETRLIDPDKWASLWGTEVSAEH